MAATRFALAALVAAALVPACTDDTTLVVDDPVGDTIAVGQARGENLAALAADELLADDLGIALGKTAAILATFNDGIIAQSSFAVQVVIPRDIFDFANRLIIDHDDANAELDAVVRFLGVGFFPSVAEDQLLAETSAALAQLRSSPPGEVEFVYVELQVIEHAKALVLLDELAFVVGPGAMADYIADLSLLVDAHLFEAENLLATFF